MKDLTFTMHFNPDSAGPCPKPTGEPLHFEWAESTWAREVIARRHSPGHWRLLCWWLRDMAYDLQEIACDFVGKGRREP